LVAREDPDLGKSFEGMARELRGLPGRARIQFTLLGGEGRSWSLELGNKRCRIAPHARAKSDLEIVTTPETWLRIAQGEQSPIDAFGRGLLSISGRMKLARLVVRKLADDENALLWLE
jgi:putative sterol carrier protein